VLVLAGIYWASTSGSGGSPSLPNLQTWTVPAGMTRFDSTTAYKWIDPAASDCISDSCWAMEVVTQNGCPNSLYVELSLEDAAGTAVGYTNDVAGSVAAGQKARLTFDSFEKSATKAKLSQVTCY